MPRIEISLAEYNGLKDKIKALESTIVDVSEDAAFYKENSLAPVSDTLQETYPGAVSFHSVQS